MDGAVVGERGGVVKSTLTGEDTRVGVSTEAGGSMVSSKLLADAGFEGVTEASTRVDITVV